MGEASMRKWLTRAYRARPGVTADDIPGWRRWILRLWKSPRLRAAMRRHGLPLYHTALHMRLRHRRLRAFTSGWSRAQRRGARAFANAVLSGAEITMLSWAGKLA